MSQSFWTHTVQILTMLIVAGALGLWLGYLLWYKWRRLHDRLQGEFDALSARNRALDSEIATLNSRLTDCENARAGVVSDPDDLKAIEGIGPKIEKLCNAIGIYTWPQLAQTSVERLQKMLDDAGPDYKVAAPVTWPRQAALAAAGHWSALQEYQDRLKGGRDVS